MFLRRYFLIVLCFLLVAVTIPARADRAHDLASQASSQATASCGDISALADCHPAKPTGCSHAANPRYDPYLNFLKNQEPTRDLGPNRTLDNNDFISIEDKIPTGIGGPHHAQFANQLADLDNGL